MKDKKVKIAITINQEINTKLEDEKINKSKLINWLLEQHYNDLFKDDEC